MTEQEQRIAIAEACGFEHWKADACGFTYVRLAKPKDEATRAGWIQCGDSVTELPLSLPIMLDGIPDYPNDLNACHEFEALVGDAYWDILAEITGCDHLPYAEGAPPGSWRTFAGATARERCEAFLRTKGLWRE